jgi:DNA-binding NtrC family response regulator
MSPSDVLPRCRVSVLTVLCDRWEHSSLLHHLRQSNWEVYSVNTIGQALAFLRETAVGVVVAQYRPSGELSWRNLLDETRGLSPAPRLIVTDPHPDEAKWAEVLNLGAYDLLPQPFAQREVSRAIVSAWHSWHGEWLLGQRHERRSA